MKRYATASLILLLVIAIALPVFGYGFGQGRGNGMMQGGFGGRGNGGYCYDDDNNTNLTAEQSKGLQALRDKHLEEITPLRSELFAKRSELKLLWNKENPNSDQIKAKQREIDTIQDQLRDKMTDYRLEAGKVIPSDQRSEFRGGFGHRGFMGRNNFRGGTGMGGMHW